MTNDELIKAQASAAAGAQKVVRTGMHLILNGYGRLALLPYIGLTGAWRCEFHVEGRPERTIFRYTAASGAKYLADHAGGEVRRTIKPSALAEAIMKSVPQHLQVQCVGDPTPENVRWLGQLAAELDADRLPFAFHEYSEPGDGWSAFKFGDSATAHTMPTPPGYVMPEAKSPADTPFWKGYDESIQKLRECDEVLLCLEDIRSEEIACIARTLWADIQGTDETDGVELVRRALEAAIAAGSC